MLPGVLDSVGRRVGGLPGGPPRQLVLGVAELVPYLGLAAGLKATFPQLKGQFRPVGEAAGYG